MRARKKRSIPTHENIAALLRSDTPLEPLRCLGRSESAIRVRQAVDAIEKHVGQVERMNDELGEKLVDFLFQGNPGHALNPSRHETDEYRAVRDAVRNELRIDSGALSRIVRVGALNRLLGPESPWASLPWTFKAALLPTLSDNGDIDLFLAGLEVATDPAMTLRSLEEWKRAALEQDGPARPKQAFGLTLRRGELMVASGVRLGSKRARTEFLKKIGALDEDARGVLVEGLKATASNLLVILEALDVSFETDDSESDALVDGADEDDFEDGGVEEEVEDADDA